MQESSHQERLMDTYSDVCQALDFIADKWATLVIAALSEGTCRYGAIKRRIGNISDKMLAQTLRKLEDKNLITRTTYPVVPPHVDYALTPLGESLVEPLSMLVGWAKDHARELAGSDPEATSRCGCVR